MIGINAKRLAAAAILAACVATAIAQPRDQDRARDQTAERDQQADRDRVQDRDRIADRDRSAERDQIRDQDRNQDRNSLHVRDRDRLRDRDIFGAQLMTEQERAQYRDRLRSITSDQEWAQAQAEHQEQMQARARERGVDLPAPAYGQFMLTARERERYRKRLERARNEQARIALRAEHLRAVRTRARELGVELPEPFYGQQLMTEQEALQLEDRLRAAATDQQRSQIRAEHRQQMQQRAREHQISLEQLETN